MTGASRIIFEDEHLRVIHRPGGSPFTLVTFGGATLRPDGVRIPAEGPVAALDLEAVGFIGKAPNWYPAASMARAAPLVAELCRGPLVGHGFGMGGYAALKYGRLLGLEAALAASPQVTIDPADVPGDRRFHNRFDPVLHAGMLVRDDDLPPFCVVLADPHFVQDRLHAERAGPPGRVARVWLPFMRQGTIGRLAGASTLREALDLLRRRDAAGIAAMLRARRGGSILWHLRMVHAAALHGHGAAAARLAARAIALGAPREEVEGARATAEREAAERRAARRGEPDATQASPRMVMAAINAALASAEPAAIAAAAGLAIATDLPVPRRRMAAQRLAVRGEALAALPVLLADPAVIRDEEARAAMVPMLGTILRDGALPPPWGAAAAALRQRILRTGLPAIGTTDAEPAAASPFRKPDPPAPRPLSRVPAVLVAQGVPPHVARQVEAAVASQGEQEAPPHRQRLALLRDVFVNDAGQVWGRDGTLHRTNGRPIPAASLAAAAHAPELEEAAWAIEPNRNIYHWTIDVLPGLDWRLDGAGAGMPALIRSGAHGYVRAWLDLAGEEPVPAVEAGAAHFVRRLHFGPTGIESLDPAGRHARFLARIAARADALRTPGAPRRIYVSRRDSRRRTVVNEAELEAALAARGFAAVTLAGRPLLEQIALFRGAEVIAGAHGAGLVHLVAAPPGRRVFEILRASGGDMRPLACFARISRLAGHDHTIALVPFAETEAPWVLDIAGTLAGLDAVLAGGGGH